MIYRFLKPSTNPIFSGSCVINNIAVLTYLLRTRQYLLGMQNKVTGIVIGFACKRGTDAARKLYFLSLKDHRGVELCADLFTDLNEITRLAEVFGDQRKSVATNPGKGV